MKLNLSSRAGLATGLVVSMCSLGVYVYAIYALISIATDVISPAHLRSEVALMTDVKIFDLVKKSKSQTGILRSQYVTERTLPGVFDTIEQIREKSGAKVVVESVSQSTADQRTTRKRSSDDEDDAPRVAEPKEVAGPQPQNLGGVQLSIEIRGAHDAVFAALRLLESLPYLVNIDQLSFRTDRVQDGEEAQRTWVLHTNLQLASLPEVSSKK